MILDIRNPTVPKIKAVRFDDSGEVLTVYNEIVYVIEEDLVESCAARIGLCSLGEIDTFIAALQKVKELWGNK